MTILKGTKEDWATDCLVLLRELSGQPGLDMPSLLRMSTLDLERLEVILSEFKQQRNTIEKQVQDAYKCGYARGEEDDRSRAFASSHGHDMGQ